MKHTFAAHAFRAHSFRPGALAGGEIIPPEPPPSDGTVIVRVDDAPSPPLEAADYVFGGLLPRYSTAYGAMPRVDRPGPHHLMALPKGAAVSLPRVVASEAPSIPRSRWAAGSLQRPAPSGEGSLQRPTEGDTTLPRLPQEGSSPLTRHRP